MDSLIKTEGLVGAYAYLDDVTVREMTQQDDGNLNRLIDVAKDKMRATMRTSAPTQPEISVFSDIWSTMV